MYPKRCARRGYVPGEVVCLERLCAWRDCMPGEFMCLERLCAWRGCVWRCVPGEVVCLERLCVWRSCVPDYSIWFIDRRDYTHEKGIVTYSRE
jgi:hypothetical protein